ncbi:uncharacterized protein LOC106457380 [Limulus polyphemus]|uniref:Uncharacterized protein LOC106457380 n=1 Tax=Limulus polyphemus TaxID=6850 RepID=A0ABM1S5U5_LIMPO|nr:uncharacterized protein LOC106457380 [Limulus polyphemus]
MATSSTNHTVEVPENDTMNRCQKTYQGEDFPFFHFDHSTSITSATQQPLRLPGYSHSFEKNLSELGTDAEAKVTVSSSLHSLGSLVGYLGSNLPSGRFAENNSLDSSINDLSFEAEQLERAIRQNDTSFVRRMLELHHARFPVNLHGSILDKSSCGSQSHCVSQDVDILLRKSQTLLDRFDRRESLSTDQESPLVFSNALHLAIEHNSLDVARLLLKYGVDPNEKGVLPTDADLRGSHCVVSSDDESMDEQRKCGTVIDSGVAQFLLSSNPSLHSDLAKEQPFLISTHPTTKLFVTRTNLLSHERTVFVSSDGKDVFYEEVYTRETLYNLPPLFLAVVLGYANLVYLLLKFGATVNVQDEYGVTPLHLAVSRNRVSWQCIHVLLEGGAKITTGNSQGISPCDLSEVDLVHLQRSLIEGALSCLTAHPTQKGSGNSFSEESVSTNR